MALLLLQDCLIDLSNINNSIPIILRDSLVYKIIEVDYFNENDSQDLIDSIGGFVKKHNLENTTIYISTVFLNIPFFEESLYRILKLNTKTIYDYVKKEAMESVEIIEIGNYFFSETKYNYKSNRQNYRAIERYSLDVEINNLVVNFTSMNYPLSSMDSILKLNNNLPADTYSSLSDLEYSQMKTHFECFNKDALSVFNFINAIKTLPIFNRDDNSLIITQMSFLRFFENKNLIYLDDKTEYSVEEKIKNDYQIKLLAHEINFQEETNFNIWTEDDSSFILKVKMNEFEGELVVRHPEKNSFKIGLLNLNKKRICMKTDLVSNLSCEILDLNEKEIITKKINFN